MNIVEINQDVKNVNIVSRIERISSAVGSNGQEYLILNLIDSTGRVEARLWNSTPKDKEKILSGSFIKVEGVVNVYRNNIQLKISSYSILTPDDLHVLNINESDFFAKAPINVEKTFSAVVALIKKMSNTTYKDITLKILKKYEKEFKTFPAAKTIHHNVIGGLLWHSSSLFYGINSTKEVYKYANIDWELALCGAILHDIGKIHEFDSVEVSDYTLEGKLLGHISMGNSLIHQTAIDLKIDKLENGHTNPDITKLQHVILSSHGKNEFGSPVEPVMIEGILVSSFDALDSRIYRINDEIAKLENNTWSGRIFSEENKMFLKHFDAKKK